MTKDKVDWQYWLFKNTANIMHNLTRTNGKQSGPRILNGQYTP